MSLKFWSITFTETTAPQNVADNTQRKRVSKYDYTIRDGPLEKLLGGRGIFEPQEFFFVIKFLV